MLATDLIRRMRAHRHFSLILEHDTRHDTTRLDRVDLRDVHNLSVGVVDGDWGSRSWSRRCLLRLRKLLRHWALLRHAILWWDALWWWQHAVRGLMEQWHGRVGRDGCVERHGRVHVVHDLKRRQLLQIRG